LTPPRDPALLQKVKDKLLLRKSKLEEQKVGKLGEEATDKQRKTTSPKVEHKDNPSVTSKQTIPRRCEVSDSQTDGTCNWGQQELHITNNGTKK
jgi:hypothetical protein